MSSRQREGSPVFARSLEGVLRQLCAKADMHWPASDEFQARFEALRGSNLLPRGRENRHRRLSPEEIANAILATVPQQPSQAGLAAKVLGGLVPAGGLEASFHKAPTLQAAIATLIADEVAREQFHTLTLSVAEGGTNSSGYAQLLYERPGGELDLTHFVSKLATSVTRAGGEKSIRAEYRHSPASREMVLNRQFFKALALEVERSAYEKEPPGSGEEYDAEEAREAEYKRLGVKPGSRYLNFGVNTHVTWLKEKLLVKFGSYEIVLMPRTETHSASVHIDLTHNRLSSEGARTVLNRFLSWLSWLDDHYAIAQFGWSGNSVPVPVQKQELAFVYSNHWMVPEQPELSDDMLRALALYREGRNAEENYLVSFAVLSYYKIFEIIAGRERNAAKKLIGKHYQPCRNSHHDQKLFEAFEKRVAEWNEASGRSLAPQHYIYDECRVAVAHGSEESVSDPDELPELQRLHVVADIVRHVARRAMRLELGIPGSPVEDFNND